MGWGVSRLIDYFETDKDVDAKKLTLMVLWPTVFIKEVIQNCPV